MVKVDSALPVDGKGPMINFIHREFGVIHGYLRVSQVLQHHDMKTDV